MEKADDVHLIAAVTPVCKTACGLTSAPDRYGTRHLRDVTCAACLKEMRKLHGSI